MCLSVVVLCGPSLAVVVRALVPDFENALECGVLHVLALVPSSVTNGVVVVGPPKLVVVTDGGVPISNCRGNYVVPLVSARKHKPTSEIFESLST